MTVFMAIVDYIPVLLFAAAAVLLQKGLYYKMNKGNFALLAAGTIIISIAGLFKATWKLLYALGICDFVALSQAFFPMQATGYLLAAISILSLVFLQKKQPAVLAAVPPVYESSMIFVVVLILGTAGICGGLGVIAHKMKQRRTVWMFVVAFVLMLCMGYLSSRDFSQAYMHWIAQITNILGQGIFLLAVRALYKADVAHSNAF